ncbi:MAG: hypothetical protein K9W43_06605 [Candidatus Thorarchaeota archaeon]|nr:hypothetical protein [Candidatus Thorarchaeota archaeon]
MPFDEDNPFDDDTEVDEDTFSATEDDDFEPTASLEEQIAAPSAPSRLQEFIKDPWPSATFVLMIIGFIIVLGTPNPIWAQWNWMLVGMYFLWILVIVTTVISLGIWNTPTKSKIRYSGLITLAVALAAGAAGTIDTLLFVSVGGGLVSGLEGSLLTASTMIVVLMLYSLWLVQRVVQGEQNLDDDAE